MNSNDLQNLSEAYNQVTQLDEGEGSYGKTPESTKRWNKATLSRMNKPASEYEKRGDKKKEVEKYSKHNQRTMALDHDASRGPGKKSSRGSGGRLGLKMTQKDRDDSRGMDEYGHTGYDPDFDGPPSAPGSKPKGKKAERQKKTGVSAESYDTYELVLSHLLEEGYASTPEAADKIILNMSESWFEEIMEARRSEKEGKGSPESPMSYPGRKIQKERGERGGRHQYSGSVEYGGAAAERGRKKSDPHSQHRRLERLSNYPEQPGKYSKMQRKKRDLGSRFD